MLTPLTTPHGPLVAHNIMGLSLEMQYMQLISYWGDFGLNSPGMLITDVYPGIQLSTYENDLYLVDTASPQEWHLCDGTAF